MAYADAIRVIGFVGLGKMGEPMARNLRHAGFELVLRDVDEERQARLAAELAGTAAGAPDAFGPADVVITILPTGSEVRSVLLDWEGGLSAALAPGTIVVDMSSSAPTGTRELGAVLAARELALVDAPVSGGVVRAESGKLAIMVGGDDEDALVRVQPVLDVLGAKIFRTGPLGSGHAMKALNNFVAASSFAATSEALLIGARFGLDPAGIVEVLNGSSGGNFSTEHTIGPHVLERAFASGFALPLMSKDIGIAADLAASVGVDAPICKLTQEIWADALEAEGTEADFTAAIRHWERINGMELPLSPPRGS